MYRRKSPDGFLVARYYCPTGHVTFSLLPDCIAARLPSALADVEEVVAAVAEEGVELAARMFRPIEITLPAAVRWVQRRLGPVNKTLLTLVTLLPAVLTGCEPKLVPMRDVLGVPELLVHLRQIAEPHLAVLPPPIGFRHRKESTSRSRNPAQHIMGPAPPRVRR